ncbi:peptidyl-glycine alpha-amidating monooxygenase isoform X1 [Tachyglossus aculeatus]|uniref:peptidyl-glycine alpha-amidating monooxygenase isoform X1 n=1 Tax=Tachyglossus aculeatus TaxID=9261 RepID=UPI0018F692E4|nr:peptidyl-glycine alpha-amidating monooxygenase isoform X1 [Tachyglossus aculeatus]
MDMAGLVSSLLMLFLVSQNGCLAFRSPLSVFKRHKEAPRTLSSDCLGTPRPVIPLDSTDFALDIRMPGVTPKQSDTYLCMSLRLPVDSEAFVVDFKPHGSMDTVHHMLLFGCNMPSSTENHWDCDEGTCTDKANILYAWARNAPPTRLPKGVGFRVGGESGSKYFVLQVHYGDISAFRDNHKDCSGVTLHLTRLQQPLIAGMYLLMSVDTVIPPGEKVVNADIACHYNNYPMHLFAYRVHTHHLGKVVSGYRVRNGQWMLIGRQSPQLPQAFYPVEQPVDVSFGDILAARCVFSGEGRKEDTRIGGTASDEMCNFYIMYYMEARHATSYMTCIQNISPAMFQTIPPEANIPIAVRSDMVMMHGHHKAPRIETKNSDPASQVQEPKRDEEEVLDQGDFYSLLSKLLGEREDVIHLHKYNPTEKAVAEIANVAQKKDLGWSGPQEGTARDERANAILVRDRIHKFHRLEATVRSPGNRRLSVQQTLRGEGVGAAALLGDFHMEEVPDWPGVHLRLGQVSGLAVDLNNRLVVFHRGDHVWDGNSFDASFVYQQRGLGPIKEATILVIDPNSAAVLQSTGKNLFYLPHGLSIDKDGNYWVTDVALHQVFKLASNPQEHPLLILGKSMQPGSDKNHFCQPTDVAVDPGSGAIYVADGYCNSRIVQFSEDGEFVTQWGEETLEVPAKPGQLSIPHSLTLVPEVGQLCVADRENGRIQCFKSATGEFVREIKHMEFGGNVFAISYVPGLLLAVNGKPVFGEGKPVQGFVMNFSDGSIIDTFSPGRKHFDMPHDIVASEDGPVYVGDVHANTVWKFATTEKMEHRSVKKAGIEVLETQEAETVAETRVKTKPAPPEMLKMQEKQKLIKKTNSGVSFLLITALLAVPIVVLLAIAAFIRWKKCHHYGADSDHKPDSSSGRILGRLRGKGRGGLNLGNFFASRKGYSRKGFDRLNTEGSDQEKDEDDGSESEEEYSAPLAAATVPPSS